MGGTVFSKGLMAVAVTTVALGLGACGVKSSPRAPEGATYPRVYPYAGPKQETVLPPASETSPDKTREPDRGQPSPLGFPLEYPNRSSYQ